MAKRIQRKRTKGWRMPVGTVYVGRPSMWGNPFSVEVSLYKDHWSVCFEGKSISAEFATKFDAQVEAVRLFEKWFSIEIAAVGTELHDFRNKYGWKGFQLACASRNLLRNKDIACWCALDEPCHADIILEVANSTELPEVHDGKDED